MGRTTGGGGIVILPVGGPVPLVQVNLGFGDITPQMSIDMLKSSTSIGFSGTSGPGNMDQYEYPVSNFTGVMSVGLPTGPISTTGPWRLIWTAKRSWFTVTLSSVASISGATNCTTNLSGGVLSVIGNPTNIGGGITGQVDIIFTSAGNAPSFNFSGTDQTPAGSSWANNASAGAGATDYISLVRVSDLSAFNSGQLLTQEFVNLYKNMNPRTLRLMGLNLLRGAAVDSNETKWSYRCAPSRFSWFSTFFPPGMWAGAISVTATTNVLTCASAPDTTASGWADGEQIGGTIASNVPNLTFSGSAANGTSTQFTGCSLNPNNVLTVGQRIWVNMSTAGTKAALYQVLVKSIDSTTAFTVKTLAGADITWVANDVGFVSYQTLSVTGKSGGAKLIVGNSALAFGYVGFQEDNAQILAGPTTFTYDKILDVLLYTVNGIQPSPPIEAQCELANRCNNCRLWYNIPTWANDDFITNALNLFHSNLNGILELEWGNELWNTFFLAAQWSVARGIIFGIATADQAGMPHAYQALRVRQINGNLVPASNYGSSMNKINRLYMGQTGQQLLFYQTFFDGSNTGDAFFPNGGLFVGGANAYYNTNINADYHTFPNRPIDVCDSTGHAPYWNGIFKDQTTGAPLQTDVANLQQIIDWTNAGGASIALANTALDNNVRYGSNRDQTFTTGGTTTFTTPLPHGIASPGSQNTYIIFKTTGGTTWSNIDPTSVYQVLTTPTTTTLTIGKCTDSTTPSSAFNPGTAGTGTTTLGCLQDNIFFNSIFFTDWEEIAAHYDSVRAGGGLPPLGVVCYEGGGACFIPTAAQCVSLPLTSPNGNAASFTGHIDNGSGAAGTTLTITSSITGTVAAGEVLVGAGIVGGTTIVSGSGTSWVVSNSQLVASEAMTTNSGQAACQVLATAVNNWKNTALAKATTIWYYDAFFGLNPQMATFGKMLHSKAGSHLTVPGLGETSDAEDPNFQSSQGGIYSLCANNDPLNPQPYQWYYGIRDFNNGSR